MKTIKVTCIFIALLIIFISCSQEKRHTDKAIFKYNESSGITSLDPAFAKDQSNIWACNHLFNRLIELDDSLNIKPSIAYRWDILDSGRVYKFYLRQDVFFHKHILFGKDSTRKVIAKDFVFSFNRLLEEKTASPGAWVFSMIKYDKINKKYDFIAENDTTLIIKLKETFPPFLSLLSMHYCSVVPYEIVQYYQKDFRNNPIGTGPFEFKFWKENEKLILLKNEKYFEKINNIRLPFIDAINITFITDKHTAFLEFIKGNLDFISGIDPSYKDELLSKDGQLNKKYVNKIYLTSSPYLNTEYLGILSDTNNPILKNNPLKLKKIRQAINYGFDRDKMIKYLRNGIGIAGIYGFVPIGLYGSNKANIVGYKYDPNKAKELLQEAGYYKLSTQENLITIATTSSYIDLCKFIQSQLNEIGMNVKIELTQPATLRELMSKTKVSFFRGSWIADYPDPENYLSLFYSKNFCPFGPNYTHFKNNNYDKLYDISRKEIDFEKRIILYKEMDEIIIEEAPVVVLYYDEVLRFVNKNIENLGSNPLNLLNLKSVRKRM
ncbi:MAG: ABC transporter substrate-binding protein [Bacteroidetes bacterium GWE2_29_8]|nr:MAG: ABC transporter substrate-binding protein [Bacteroidetes bacterium GWE2_29_8]OFY24366.1 MAG: ABC transporter substrate-binding protein [Bacteroidetes bacterium GWF2_29_10]